jgi:import inner membrane translocase subunit TIM21
VIFQIIVTYLLYTELFAADSKTRQFNHAVDRVKSDSRCIELLGRPASKIKAYGEPTTNKWARARPLAYTTETDKFGTTHFRMHFHVEGTEAHGVVNVYMTKRKEEKELAYELLSLNVPGQPVVYLENKADEVGVKAKVGKMFGVQWR